MFGGSTGSPKTKMYATKNSSIPRVSMVMHGDTSIDGNPKTDRQKALCLSVSYITQDLMVYHVSHGATTNQLIDVSLAPNPRKGPRTPRHIQPVPDVKVLRTLIYSSSTLHILSAHIICAATEHFHASLQWRWKGFSTTARPMQRECQPRRVSRIDRL